MKTHEQFITEVLTSEKEVETAVINWTEKEVESAVKNWSVSGSAQKRMRNYSSQEEEHHPDFYNHTPLVMSPQRFNESQFYEN